MRSSKQQGGICTMEKLEKTAAALRRRGFDAAIFETAKEAADYLLSDMPAGETVGLRRLHDRQTDGA